MDAQHAAGAVTLPAPAREAPAYIWLRHSAALALAAAEREDADSQSHAMSAMIHTALMAEAFLDFVGGRLDRDWPAKSRRFSRYKRLRVFRLALGIGGDIKARPWRSVAEAFDFHDLVMHGRIDVEEKREALGLRENDLPLYAIGESWWDFCTWVNARRLFDDTNAAIGEHISALEGR